MSSRRAETMQRDCAGGDWSIVYDFAVSCGASLNEGEDSWQLGKLQIAGVGWRLGDPAWGRQK